MAKNKKKPEEVEVDEAKVEETKAEEVKNDGDKPELEAEVLKAGGEDKEPNAEKEGIKVDKETEDLDKAFKKISTEDMAVVLKDADKYVPSIRGAIMPYRYQMNEEQYDQCLVHGVSYMLKIIKPKKLIVEINDNIKKKVAFR